MYKRIEPKLQNIDNICQNYYGQDMTTFGEIIRNLRLQQNVPLRVVAAAVEIDSTLLSRFELGERFPTGEQLKRFATYFQCSLEDLAAQLIADRIIAAYGNDSVTMKAAAIVQERIAEYDDKSEKQSKRAA
jgi:transcriptional regulator with XRE-family HTH domain